MKEMEAPKASYHISNPFIINHVQRSLSKFQNLRELKVDENGLSYIWNMPNHLRIGHAAPDSPASGAATALNRATALERLHPSELIRQMFNTYSLTLGEITSCEIALQPLRIDGNKE